MFRFSLLPLLAAGFLATSAAQAATVVVEGDFSVTFNQFDDSFQGVPVYSGTWSFEYDDSTVPQDDSITIPLASFSANVAIGTVSYTASNTEAFVMFSGGDILSVIIGGTPNGGDTVSSVNSDFFVYYEAPDSVLVAALSVSGASGIDQSISTSGSFTSVPEPATAAVAAVLLALGGSRRRR